MAKFRLQINVPGPNGGALVWTDWHELDDLKWLESVPHCLGVHLSETITIAHPEYNKYKNLMKQFKLSVGA